MDGAILLFQALAAIYYTIVGTVQKIGFRKRLSKGLGRQATDQELLSISTWMRIPEVEKPTPAPDPGPQVNRLRSDSQVRIPRSRY